MQIGGSIALVTGANRGLGLAFTRELVRRGETNYFGTLSMCRAPTRCDIGTHRTVPMPHRVGYRPGRDRLSGGS
jgi:hypothetical protein